MTETQDDRTLTILVSTRHFDVDENISVKFGDFYIEKNQSEDEFDNTIFTPEVFLQFGSNAKLQFINRTYFITETAIAVIEDFNRFITIAVQQLIDLFNFLWFSKDNSSNIIEVYCFHKTEFSKSLVVKEIYTKADGRFTDVVFSEEDFDLAYELYNLCYSDNKGGDPQFANTINDNANDYYLKPDIDYYYLGLNRIERALNFLQQARSANHLAQKISYYVLVLECLFAADDKTEIQHKISERIAKYIGNNFEERKILYNKMKAYYAIRSSYVHGSKMDNKYNSKDKLYPFSLEIDDLIRKIFTKIIKNHKDIFLLNKDELQTWFNDLMFS